MLSTQMLPKPTILHYAWNLIGSKKLNGLHITQYLSRDAKYPISLYFDNFPHIEQLGFLHKDTQFKIILIYINFDDYNLKIILSQLSTSFNLHITIFVNVNITTEFPLVIKKFFKPYDWDFPDTPVAKTALPMQGSQIGAELKPFHLWSTDFSTRVDNSRGERMTFLKSGVGATGTCKRSKT